MEAELDVLSSPPPPPSPSSVMSSKGPKGSVRVSHAIGERAAAVSSGAGTELAPRAPTTGSGDGQGWTFDARTPRDITTSESIARATRGIGTAEVESRPSVGGLVEGLNARDVSIGLGRGGPFLTALEGALAGDDAPFEGSATFDMGVDTSGRVSVVLIDASVASAGWLRVADAARSVIDPKRIRIPPGAPCPILHGDGCGIYGGLAWRIGPCGRYPESDDRVTEYGCPRFVYDQAPAASGTNDKGTDARHRVRLPVVSQKV